MAKKKAKTESLQKVDPETTVESAMDELGGIVGALESGQTPLDESLKQFERGMSLLRHCHTILDAAAERIELVTRLDEDGTVETTDFDGTASITRTDQKGDEGSSLF